MGSDKVDKSSINQRLHDGSDGGSTQPMPYFPTPIAISRGKAHTPAPRAIGRIEWMEKLVVLLLLSGVPRYEFPQFVPRSPLPGPRTV